MNFELGYKWIGFILVSGLSLMALLFIIALIVGVIYGILHPEDTSEELKEIVKSVKEIL